MSSDLSWQSSLFRKVLVIFPEPAIFDQSGLKPKKIGKMAQFKSDTVSIWSISFLQNVEAEAASIVSNNRPPTDWPKEGTVVFKDYHMRYRPKLPLAFNGIDCDIKPKEKIGIVGRTGSGKVIIKSIDQSWMNVIIKSVTISHYADLVTSYVTTSVTPKR